MHSDWLWYLALTVAAGFGGCLALKTQAFDEPRFVRNWVLAPGGIFVSYLVVAFGRSLLGGEALVPEDGFPGWWGFAQVAGRRFFQIVVSTALVYVCVSLGLTALEARKSLK